MTSIRWMLDALRTRLPSFRRVFDNKIHRLPSDDSLDQLKNSSKKNLNFQGRHFEIFSLVFLFAFLSTWILQMFL